MRGVGDSSVSRGCVCWWLSSVLANVGSCCTVVSGVCTFNNFCHSVSEDRALVLICHANSQGHMPQIAVCLAHYMY